MDGEQDQYNSESSGRPFKKFALGLVGVLLIVAGISGATVFLVTKSPQVLGLSKSSEQNQAEIDKLLAEVGKLIALPTDEKPTVATVSDSEKVKEQAFFKQAQNGDKVIIYTNARKAILYRPSEKQIVEVGAVNIQQRSPAPGSTNTPAATSQATPKPADTPKPATTPQP